MLFKKNKDANMQVPSSTLRASTASTIPRYELWSRLVRGWYMNLTPGLISSNGRWGVTLLTELRHRQTITTLCLKKTSPTFLTVTWKPIIRFWQFLAQLAIKWPFSFLPHRTFVSALPRKSRSNKIRSEINRKPEKISPTLLIATWIKISRF